MGKPPHLVRSRHGAASPMMPRAGVAFVSQLLDMMVMPISHDHDPAASLT
jgi:hypothetical protein